MFTNLENLNVNTPGEVTLYFLQVVMLHILNINTCRQHLYFLLQLTLYTLYLQLPLQTVWTQIWPNKKLGLTWIQTLKNRPTTKRTKNYPVRIKVKTGLSYHKYLHEICTLFAISFLCPPPPPTIQTEIWVKTPTLKIWKT